LTLEIGLANWNHNENTNQGKQGHKRIYDNKKQINKHSLYSHIFYQTTSVQDKEATKSKQKSNNKQTRIAASKSNHHWKIRTLISRLNWTTRAGNELAGARWLTGRRTRKQSNKIWPEQNDALKAEKRSRPGARESERREKREKAVGTEKRSRPGARESERREKREKAVGTGHSVLKFDRYKKIRS
jgi:hypothetical protein